MSRDDSPGSTTPHANQPPPGVAVRGFRLTAVEGPDTGTSWESDGDSATIGTHESCDLQLTDSTVSRFHCELRLETDGTRVRDLESRNGTILDGTRIVDAYVKGGSLLRLGRTVVQFEFAGRSNQLALSDQTSFGELTGESVAMRALFARLERAASATATVLLEGETGTGKSAAARSLHAVGPRSGRPFVMIDCGAIPANLLESELFGHEKGAFTGAATARIGAFEEADGGTLFLDEIGELPIELQPKLLSALEDRAVRRVGSNSRREVDVRLVAATNRDLRAEVNATRFREDLYFRIAVLRITLPPLRLRPKDLPALATSLLDRLGASPEQRDSLLTPELLDRLQASAWPGNVRELRNYLEQCLVFDGAVPLEAPALPADNAVRVDTSLPFADAKRRAQSEIERAYLVELLAVSGGKVARAAAAAGIDRTYFYKLLRRHGIQPARG